MSTPDDAALIEAWKPYFVAEYQRDTRNASRQTFDDYWRWVRSLLLEGGSGYEGWLAQTASAAAQIRDAAARDQVGALAQDLGRRIAGEWAKDSACRRIYSNPFQGRPNLLDWGGRIQRAARRDGGDGGALHAALLEIAAEVDAVVGRR